MRRLCLLVAYATLLGTPALITEAQTPSAKILLPSEEELFSAAHQAFDGGKLEKPFKLYQKLAGWNKVDSVYVMTPARMAAQVGADKRSKFADAPTVQDVADLKGKIGLEVTLVFRDKDSAEAMDVDVAIAKGGAMFRPTQKQASLNNTTIQHDFVTYKRTDIGYAYVFDFGTDASALPSGKVKLLVRRSDNGEEEIQLDLDKLPSSAFR